MRHDPAPGEPGQRHSRPRELKKVPAIQIQQGGAVRKLFIHPLRVLLRLRQLGVGFPLFGLHSVYLVMANGAVGELLLLDIVFLD